MIERAIAQPSNLLCFVCLGLAAGVVPLFSGALLVDVGCLEAGDDGCEFV